MIIITITIQGCSFLSLHPLLPRHSYSGMIQDPNINQDCWPQTVRLTPLQPVISGERCFIFFPSRESRTNWTGPDNHFIPINKFFSPNMSKYKI